MAKSSKEQPVKSTRKEVYTVEFAQRSEEIPRPGTGILAECGYRPDSGEVAPEYLARITSLRNAITVIGVLQEDIVTRVESRWEPLIPYSLLAKGNILVQVVTGGRKSLVSKATSRRLWQGSSPMTLSLKLKFEAVENPFTDVVEPVRLLQSMALPTEPTGQTGKVNWELAYDQAQQLDLRKAANTILSGLPVLSPPGPTPFTTEGLLNLKGPKGDFSETTKTIEGLKGGDLIMVELGRLLTFYNVVVRTVTGAHAIKFDSNGDAVSAVVDVVFETYEMMTVESLRDSYRKTIVSVSRGEGE